MFWKAWFDVRQRFFLILILWVVLIGETRLDAALSSTRAAEVVQAQGASAPADAQFMSYGYDRLVEDWTTGQANGTFSILAILLAVGGVLGRATGRPDLLTLSLPASRGSWLWAQAAMAVLLLYAVALLEALSVLVTAWGFGIEVPDGAILLSSLLVTLSAAIWIWPTVLAMVLLRDSIRAAIVTIAAMVAAATFGILGSESRPFFRNIADVTLWDGSVPWAPVLAGAVLTVLTGWLALRRFDRMEF